MADRHRQERADIFRGSWKGKGALLNALRSTLAARQAAEKAALRDRHKLERAALRRDMVRFPSCEEWLSRFKGDHAQEWRHRWRCPATIEGPKFDPPALRDITAFSAVVDGGRVHYHSTGSPGAPAFTDRGQTIDIHDSGRRQSVLAALQLSAQKWATITVRGGEQFKRTCVELAGRAWLQDHEPGSSAGNRRRARTPPAHEKTGPSGPSGTCATDVNDTSRDLSPPSGRDHSRGTAAARRSFAARRRGRCSNGRHGPFPGRDRRSHQGGRPSRSTKRETRLGRLRTASGQLRVQSARPGDASRAQDSGTEVDPARRSRWRDRTPAPARRPIEIPLISFDPPTLVRVFGVKNLRLGNALAALEDHRLIHRTPTGWGRQPHLSGIPAIVSARPGRNGSGLTAWRTPPRSCPPVDVPAYAALWGRAGNKPG